MHDMKQLVDYMKEHPIVIVVTAVAAVVGAVLGAIAFYRHWLGLTVYKVRRGEMQYEHSSC